MRDCVMNYSTKNIDSNQTVRIRSVRISRYKTSKCAHPKLSCLY